MSGIVFGYLRESNDDDASPEGQRLDIVRLAERHGIDPDSIELLSDFGFSGRNNERPGWVTMKHAIADGQVAAVLARSVDRLGRDAADVIAFEALCFAKGVRVLTERDGERSVNPDDVNVFQRWVPALVAEEESRLGRLRARKARATRLRNRLTHLGACTAGNACSDALHWDGVPPYGTLPGEDIHAVLRAFLDAGSYAAAAKLLNEQGVRPRRGSQWESTSVIRIVKRNRASLDVALPTRKHRGSRALAVHTFARMIECPADRSILVATNRVNRGVKSSAYFCAVGRRTKDHPKPWSVAEHFILDWTREVFRNVLFEDRTVSAASEVASTIADLAAKRGRVAQAYIDGALDELAYHEQLGSIDATLDNLAQQTRTSLSFRLGIDWRLPDRDLNAQLRELIQVIRLDDSMRPRGMVVLREPTFPHPDDEDEVITNPAAVREGGGWWLPS
jgi:DNA invertase Pin-like site-specific DNA recombinase